jgi:hypothetical protein
VRHLGPIFFLLVFAISFAISHSMADAKKPTPNATRLLTLDGHPISGPANSDCQIYQYSGGAVAINCPVNFFPISGTHTVLPNEWGGVLVASGGGSVSIILPVTATIGRNVIGFATDGVTGFTISTQPPMTMQGSGRISNGQVVAPPNSNGWAGLFGTIYQIDMQ